ncbi:MAG: Smr/MutS family protein [Saprospiraceae bacterium]
MLIINEIWIGDRLRIKGSETIGTYEGKDSEFVLKIKVNFEILKIHIDQLEVAPEEVREIDLGLNNTAISESTLKHQHFRSSIDLHIESLAPELINARAERIILKQLKAFEEFMKSAITNKIPHVTIIHGKGEGVLRSEVQFRLKHHFNAKIIQLTNQDGATEAWL